MATGHEGCYVWKIICLESDRLPEPLVHVALPAGFLFVEMAACSPPVMAFHVNPGGNAGGGLRVTEFGFRFIQYPELGSGDTCCRSD